MSSWLITLRSLVGNVASFEYQELLTLHSFLRKVGGVHVHDLLYSPSHFEVRVRSFYTLSTPSYHLSSSSDVLLVGCAEIKTFVALAIALSPHPQKLESHTSLFRKINKAKSKVSKYYNRSKSKFEWNIKYVWCTFIFEIHCE